MQILRLLRRVVRCRAMFVLCVMVVRVQPGSRVLPMLMLGRV